MTSDGFSFSTDYFELFGLQPAIDIDVQALRDAFMQLQRQYHPDRFAAGSATEKRLAVQITSYVNEAQQVLNDPLKRAAYCLKLRGVDTDNETDSSMPADFLMEQIELREELEEIEDASEPYEQLETVRDQLQERQNEFQSETRDCLASDDLDGARAAVRKWQFMHKLDREAQSIEARLDDNP